MLELSQGMACINVCVCVCVCVPTSVRVFKVKNPLKRLPRARELAAKDREKLQRELEREEETQDKDWSKFLR